MTRTHYSWPKRTIRRETFVTLIERTFDRYADKPAIDFLRNGKTETSLSFGQLHRHSTTLAHTFASIGLKEGDCAIISLPKCLHWVVAYIALQKLGAIIVPLNPDFRPGELRYFVETTDPRLAVSGMGQKETISRIAPTLPQHTVDAGRPYRTPPAVKGETGREIDIVGLDDPALIVFTSGTTGRPKGAVLTQSNLSHDAQNIANIWEIGPEDRLCHALPLFHVHGLCFALHTCLVAGATMVMLDAFDPTVVLEVLSREDTTIFMAVPTMYHRLLQQHPAGTKDYSHIRLLTSGSAPLLEKDFERIKHGFGKEPVEREGMSETLMNFSNPIHGKRKAGSVGLPLPYLQVRIVNPDTLRNVKAGHIGEIWLRGPAVTPGYWKNPEETDRAFHKGWFRTGDLGRKDPEGYYYIADRLKNIIISGGENISPKEVENVINSHPDVVEASVVGLPDETWGETVAAAVVLTPSSTLTTQDIATYCKKELLDWKCPKRFVVLSELPKNAMGKILRDKVRELMMKPFNEYNS